MASKHQQERERIVLLLNDVGSTVLQEVLNKKLFCLFLKQNQALIEPSLKKSEVQIVFTQTLFLDDLKDESILKTIIEKGRKGIYIGNNANVDTMRDVIVKDVIPSTLHGLVLEKETKLREIKNNPLSRIKFENLFTYNQDISKLDLTVLCFLLFNLFDVKPTHEFNEFPQEQHTEEGDDILRLRLYRNQLCHNEEIEASSTWEGICGAIIRLTNKKEEFETKIEKNQKKCIDEETKEQYKKVIQLWQNQDKQAQDIRDLKEWTEKEILKQTEEIREITKRSTDAIQIAIKRYKEETEQTLEELMVKSGEKLMQCMSVKEGEVRGTCVKIEEILYNLQQDMDIHFVKAREKMSKDMETKVADYLEEGMANLRNMINKINDTFIKSIKESINHIGEDFQCSQTEAKVIFGRAKRRKRRNKTRKKYRKEPKAVEFLSERNKTIFRNNLEEFEEKIKTAVESKPEIIYKWTTEEEMEMQKDDDEKEAMAKTKEFTASDSPSDVSRSDESKIFDKLRVTNLPGSATRGKLKSFFKSEKKSGGGNVEFINIEKTKNQAIIVFKKPSDANRVLQRMPQVFEDHTIYAEIYYSDDETEEEEVSDETEEEEAMGSVGSNTVTEKLPQTVNKNRHDSVIVHDTGKFTLKIYQGDITDVRVDAIVSPTNASFHLKNGAVKTKGGSELQKQILAKREQMTQDGVAVTSGGKLPCHYVIHINTEEISISSLTLHILRAVRETPGSGIIKTIAFSTSGMWLERSAEEKIYCFVSVLMDFQSLYQQTSLEEVHIVVSEEDMKQKFSEALKCGRESTVETPSTWLISPDVKLNVVSLQGTDTDFQNVAKALSETIGTKRSILSVKRIENRPLYSEWVAKKNIIKIKNPPDIQTVRHLWYGATQSAIDTINKYGFCYTKKRTELGHGVFFTVDADQSTLQGNIDSDGNYNLYLCSVSTGKYTKGTSHFWFPPRTPNSAAGVYFDSVVDNEDNPKTFVIFDYDQAYPDFLITFK